MLINGYPRNGKLLLPVHHHPLFGGFSPGDSITPHQVSRFSTFTPISNMGRPLPRTKCNGDGGRDRFVSGKNNQNAVRTMGVTDKGGRVLFCSPTEPGICADITHARQSGLVGPLVDGPAVEIPADAATRGWAPPGPVAG